MVWMKKNVVAQKMVHGEAVINLLSTVGFEGIQLFWKMVKPVQDQCLKLLKIFDMISLAMLTKFCRVSLFKSYLKFLRLP